MDILFTTKEINEKKEKKNVANIPVRATMGTVFL